MADPINASADDESSQSTVDRVVHIFLKNIGAERESRIVDREDQKIWRTLGAAWRACANRVVSTVLVPFGERRTAELGHAFPCADGVVLDLLGSGTGDALDVQVSPALVQRLTNSEVAKVDIEATHRRSGSAPSSQNANH
jgi:hypothetical protein